MKPSSLSLRYCCLLLATLQLPTGATQAASIDPSSAQPKQAHQVQGVQQDISDAWAFLKRGGLSATSFFVGLAVGSASMWGLVRLADVDLLYSAIASCVLTITTASVLVPEGYTVCVVGATCGILGFFHKAYMEIQTLAVYVNTILADAIPANRLEACLEDAGVYHLSEDCRLQAKEAARGPMEACQEEKGISDKVKSCEQEFVRAGVSLQDCYKRNGILQLAASCELEAMQTRANEREACFTDRRVTGPLEKCKKALSQALGPHLTRFRNKRRQCLEFNEQARYASQEALDKSLKKLSYVDWIYDLRKYHASSRVTKAQCLERKTTACKEREQNLDEKTAAMKREFETCELQFQWGEGTLLCALGVLALYGIYKAYRYFVSLPEAVERQRKIQACRNLPEPLRQQELARLQQPAKAAAPYQRLEEGVQGMGKFLMVLLPVFIARRFSPL